jgi:nucleoid DNA-binding protein
MSKTKLKQFICKKTGITPVESGIIVDVVIQGMTENLLEDNKLTIPNFGSFKIKESKARIARNPRTGEQIQLPDRSVVRFKPSGKLKKLIK